MSINLFMIIYTGHDKMLDESRLEYRYRLVNELCVCSSTFFYIQFAGNIEKPETEHMIGNFTCGFISFIMILNFPVIIYINYKYLRLGCRKHYARTPWQRKKLERMRNIEIERQAKVKKALELDLKIKEVLEKIK